MVWTCLRSLDSVRCQQLHAVARLTAAGLSAHCVEVDRSRRYLHLRVEVGQVSFDAWLGVERWFAVQLPELAELAWAAADGVLLLELFAATAENLQWQDGWLRTTRVSAVAIWSPPETVLGSMLCLATNQGEVLCRTLPETLWPPAPLAPWLRTMPLRLQLRLGRQMLSHELLANMETADVLLLDEYQPQLRCNGRLLYYFSMQQEHIMLESPVSESEEVMPWSHHQIPMSVEFILQELTLTLDELNDLSPGQVISLKPDAERQVQLRVNGVLLARGELVELNQQLGVEITQLLLTAR